MSNCSFEDLGYNVPGIPSLEELIDLAGLDFAPPPMPKPKRPELPSASLGVAAPGIPSLEELIDLAGLDFAPPDLPHNVCYLDPPTASG